MPKLLTPFDCGLTVVLTYTTRTHFTSTQTINESTPILIRAIININDVGHHLYQLSAANTARRGNTSSLPDTHTVVVAVCVPKWRL